MRTGWGILGISACSVMLAAVTACSGQPDNPLGSSQPSSTPVLPIETITPHYSELSIDRATNKVPTVPWQLVRVDRQENRIYLSASTTGCSHPNTVRVAESDSSIRITVTGTGGAEPCRMQYVTLIGYVQLDSLGDRQVVGNTS